jgi:hypothetical protein
VAPGAGRPLYAAFLDEAADWLRAPDLVAAADAFRESGRHWAGLADFIAGVEDDAVRRECARSEDRMATLDLAGDCAASENPMELVEAQQDGVADCRLTKDQARSIYSEMSRRLALVVAAERAAVDAMAGAVGRPIRVSGARSSA